MKTDKLLELWSELEALNQMGAVKRLYDSSIPYHIFITFTSGDRSCGIAFSYSNNIKVNISPFSNLKELRVSLYDDQSYADSKLMVIELLSQSHRETFSSLCCNLIDSVVESHSETEIIATVVNQLEKWRNLFDRTSTSSMSIEQQQGLYGELNFLQKLMSRCDISPETAVDYWVGTEGAPRDFQGKEWAVEVKTTSSSSKKVKINGERQLDESSVSELFLYHCSIEVSKANGESLPEKVRKLRFVLSNSASALSIFNENLLIAGYYDEDANLYLGRCYKIRGEHYYRIKDAFPRIKENEIRSGVCEVNYSINLSAFNDYCVTENELFNTLMSHERY